MVSNTMDLTRRALLQGAAGLAGSLAVGGETTPPQLLQSVSYSSVELLDGPAKRQFDTNHAFFLSLSEDRLLKIYRQRIGLPAPGEDMGGWYDTFCPGAHFGQYVSALARFAAVTGSAPTAAKVSRLIDGYAQTLDPTGKFFVDLRYPGYTYDKLVIALIDAHSLLHNLRAVEVLRYTTKAAQPHMPERALTSEEQRTRPHKDETYTWDETYTMAENLFLAYERTGDRQYFDMGKRYLLDRTFFDPLAAGQNVLPGLHAYSHVNALSSGMQGYLKLGDPKYFRAVTNAVNFIWADQSFATGGWGPNEGFVEPGKGRLGKSLTETHRSFETPCGAYAHFKVMRYLMAVTGDSRYGDSMEQVLYNTVLGAKPIREDGWSFYYSDYGIPAHKTDHRIVADSPWPWDHDGRWPCCSGTLPQIASDYGMSSYFTGSTGAVYVNLYLPSRFQWTNQSARFRLTQQTNYPTENLVRMQMQASRPSEFALHLRIPEWAGPNTSVSVNGKRVTGSIPTGRFYQIRRTWKDNDVVEFELDQRVSTRAVDKQTPDQVAIVRGPQVLFAIADKQPELAARDLARLNPQRASRNDWNASVGGQPLLLRPFYDIGDEQYQTYLKVAD